MYVNLKLYGYVGCVEWIANAHGAQQERISMSASDRQAALDYHEFPVPGKISVNASKPLVTQRDLGLAYTPGVAAACEEIAADPFNAFRYTGRGNLVGEIGRAHVCTPVTNAHLVCRLLL